MDPVTETSANVASVPGRSSPQRGVRALLKHPAVSPYVRLGAAVLVLNAIIAVLVWPDLTQPGAADLALANLAAAIFLRQRHVVNIAFRLATRMPMSWPYTLRWAAGKVSHYGGLHVGTATSGVAWYLISVGFLVRRGEPVVLPIVIAAGLVVLTALAVRPVRERWHDLFERAHRWGGWALLVLVVADTVRTSGGATWQPWVVGLVVLSAAWPWLRLRRVPVEVTRHSRHAVSVRFPHPPTFPPGSAVTLSLAPLREWHSFAAIGTGEGGYGRVLISRAGDWTGRFIDDPPSHVWLKGGPIAGMGGAAALFPRVLFVATGSGIGPLMSVMTRRDLPFRLLWITRDPVATYGEELLAEVRQLAPDFVVWNTGEQGKPDVLALTEQHCAESGAEAVICVSNKRLTWQVVTGMEQRGIASYGAIWDS